jgi:beta-N-acetylhexosaminidase
VPVLIDQEGGRVERMGAPHWRQWLPPLDQVAKNPRFAERGMYLRYRIIAAEMRDVGLDANCAPCGDIAFENTHAVLKNRCYGHDAQAVAGIARAVANGMLAGGVLPVVKHIPGHGRASLDSHLELPVVSAGTEALCGNDFAVYKALNDLPVGMSAHIVYTAFGQTGPATTSAKMTGIIRDDIGFDGVLMTDDLSMEALAGTVEQRVSAALAAGMDIILHCNGDMAEMEQVAGAAGPMTDRAQNRADMALEWRKTPDDADIGALEAELAHILDGGGNG